MYQIRMGKPNMLLFWTALRNKAENGTASADDVRLYKRMKKALKLLSENPRHPGLQSHKISALSKLSPYDVWESYLQNNAPSAGRLFWAYGPDTDSITILAIEPHPNDRGAYQRVKLSNMDDAT